MCSNKHVGRGVKYKSYDKLAFYFDYRSRPNSRNGRLRLALSKADCEINSILLLMSSRKWPGPWSTFRLKIKSKFAARTLIVWKIGKTKVYRNLFFIMKLFYFLQRPEKNLCTVVYYIYLVNINNVDLSATYVLKM